MQLPELLKSKKFQAALVALVVVIIHGLVPSLKEVDLYALLTPIVAYIIGQGLADFQKHRHPDTTVNVNGGGTVEEIIVEEEVDNGLRA